MNLFLVLLGCKDPATLDSAVEPVEDPVDEEIPESFEVTGQIVDDEGAPIENANVMVGGRPETLVLTDANGNFSLWYTNIYKGEPAIVASKLGYRAKGYEFFKPDTPISMSLREVKAPDNPDYTFQNPGTGYDEMEENCSHCHTDFVRDFWTSKHSEAASNPLLHDLYNGVTRLATTVEECEAFGGAWQIGVEPGTDGNPIYKCHVEHGVLSDLNPICAESEQACDDPNLDEGVEPTAFGGCADCHAPGINGQLMDRNLHDAIGLAYDAGVHCDTCHKVKDIDMTKPAGYGSRLVVHRPGEPGRNIFEWDPVYYGPIIDVPNVAMAASPQDKFNQSVFCAGCHEHEQPALVPETTLDTEKWPEGLPIQSTYSEWESGPFNNPDTPCQWCHMPSYVDKTNAVDIATVENQSITFGFPRPVEDVRQHIFRSPFEGEPRLIDTAVHLSIQTDIVGDELAVSTSVANVGCGHAIPTGEPMRAMYVLIDVETDCGEPVLQSGSIVDEIGGRLASGVVGESILRSDNVLQWTLPDSLDFDAVTLKVLRSTGEYQDYTGIGYFAESERTLEEKGMPNYTLVGQTAVIQVADGLAMNEAIELQEGDKLFLVSTSAILEDGMPSQGLVGRTGQSFAKVLVDAEGTLQVPHYKATDILRDNRIPPGSNLVLPHTFQLGEGCTTGTVTATMLYRPHPMNLSQQYGWDAQDFVIAQTNVSW